MAVTKWLFSSTSPQTHSSMSHVPQHSAAQWALLQGLGLAFFFFEGKVLLHLWCDFRDAFP